MDLFIASGIGKQSQQQLGPGSVLLPGFALADERALLIAIKAIEAESPFRNMITPGGFEMSVAMTNCGHLGWVTDHTGYRYDTVDPTTRKPWPVMPKTFLELATSAALAAGFATFSPDACLINRYETSARMGLHQDKNEIDFSQPIVSVSLGVPAIFQFGGFKRADKTQRILLSHGDVLVWGGPDRMRYHGILPLKQNHHPLLGSQRLNLTFRKAG